MRTNASTPRGAISFLDLSMCILTSPWPRWRPREATPPAGVGLRTLWPTGELWEAAFGSALQHAIRDSHAHLGDAGLSELLRAEVRQHLAAGITHAHDPCVPPSMHQRMAELRAATPLRLSWATGPESG